MDQSEMRQLRRRRLREENKRGEVETLFNLFHFMKNWINVFMFITIF